MARFVMVFEGCGGDARFAVEVEDKGKGHCLHLIVGLRRGIWGKMSLGDF